MTWRGVSLINYTQGVLTVPPSLRSASVAYPPTKTTSSSSFNTPSHHFPYSTTSRRCINETHPSTTPFHAFPRRIIPLETWTTDLPDSIKRLSPIGIPNDLPPRRCLAHFEGGKPSQGDHRSIFAPGIKRHTVHRPSVMAKGFHDLSEKSLFTVKWSPVGQWPGLRSKRSPILCS